MAPHAPKEAQPRLLIFEQRMMGDAIMSLPFIRAAASRFEVHVACAPGTAAIFALALPSTRIHVWHPPWLEASGGSRPAPWRQCGFRAYLKHLRQLAPDTAVSVWADSRVHFLMARCGARTRIGFPMSKQNYYAHHLPHRRRQLRIGRLLSAIGSTLNGSPQLTQKLSRAHTEQHHMDGWRQLAQALHLLYEETTPWFTPPSTPLPEPIASPLARARSEGKPIWLIHAGARDPDHRWPLPYFIEIIRDEIAAHGAQPVLVDSPEVRWPDELRGQFPTYRAESLSQLIALFNACDGLLCNDTGVSHLAAALGKSVIAIFLSSNPHWFAPHGPRCQWIATEQALKNPSVGNGQTTPPRPEELDLRDNVRKAFRTALNQK
ncbi:MAG: glycosyltransferase family 9 protein [Kiritimatiellae bacterium]|nr:glycosyltransferase family 9 protein [Kiritimatiellia bacterium]